MNDHLKNYEESIRADERARMAKRYDKAIDLIAKGLQILEQADPVPLDDLAALAASKSKVERKVKATVGDCVRIENILANALKNGQGAYTLKEIARVVALGPKITGAALRQLVAEKKAVEGPRGKFRAVEKPAAAEDEARA